MNRKNLIIGTALIFILLITGGLFFQQFGSQIHPTNTVKLTLVQPDITVVVYKESDTTDSSTKIADVSSTKTLSLVSGNYYYLVTGEHVAPESVKFTVPGAAELRINPVYTSDYLRTLLPAELPQINQVIKTQYPKVTGGYIIHTGKLYQQGEWYATIISDKRSTNKDPYDDHRIVLRKQNNEWVIMTQPEINLAAVDYPDVPREILSDINKLDPIKLQRQLTPASFD